MGSYFNIQIFPIAGKSYSERCRKRHDLMGAESFRISHIDSRSSDCLLKKPHDVQMPDKAHRPRFCKFYSHFHSALLSFPLLPLRFSKQTPPPNWFAPHPWQYARQFGETFSASAFSHSLFKKSFFTPQSKKSQGNVSSA